MKTLDARLAAIHADPAGSTQFILADAKDADMAFGLAATGVDPVTGRRRSLAGYREQMRVLVRQGLVDIMLMSASTGHLLSAREGIFDGSPVTPAVRGNDSTDIHMLTGARYPGQPSRPLRTATARQIRAGADLALYSLTPLNDAGADSAALAAYREFRVEAEAAGLRHFLEVFPPNVPQAVPAADLGPFLNDFVARSLAGVPAPSRPLFLKIPYTGPAAMEDLASYDPHLVPGILGGGAGTTFDCFLLLEEARRHGARAALFGRKINASEDQPAFVRHLRAIADGELGAREACRSYHADLARLGIRPHRPLADDLLLTPAGPAGSTGAAHALRLRGGCAILVPAPRTARETAAVTPSLADLRARLPGLMAGDQSRIGRRIGQAAALTDPAGRERAVGRVLTELAAAQARVEARRLAVPAVSYPPALPVSQRRAEIAAAIRDHQVVIVAGETGSGKTTQLPKICLELGRGVTGQIGHTQPRRIAARTVAERIAAELGTPLGAAVGYQVRFNDTSSDRTLVKVMTDGILLTEMQRDRRLLRYDTLIIDEAHERSLNIDFILGYLRRLLPARPDLKVIITSATIDPGRFSAHFGAGGGPGQTGTDGPGETGGPGGSPGADGPGETTTTGPGQTGTSNPGDPRESAAGDRGRCAPAVPGAGAPVIEVSGRTYPVEIRYRPLTAATAPDDTSPDDTARDDTARDDTARDGAARGRPGRNGAGTQQRGARTQDGAGTRGGARTAAEPRDQVQAICDAVAELRALGPGDILVFLSGEREIRDTADALAGEDGLEVLPLYARLSTAEQHRVFQPHRGRRVVLATNVAETSLTVPGVRYVIDPGTARISRYSHRTKVQRLPIEPVSQASANQRAGRCGRMSDGVCIRLYSQEDFAARPAFTDPEVLRTNLASVILRMAALGLGDVANFPFVDPPDSRNITDGIALLHELGALAAGGEAGPRRAGSRGAGSRGAGSRSRGPGAGRPGQGPDDGLRLTGVGRKLANLPVDPRLGRMILEAGRNGCAHEVLVITAALAIVDPRERPADAREAADAMHARFAEPGSDFLTFLHLWDYLRDRQRELSSSALRRLCRREYLHYLRVREWQDVYGQLRQAARDVGIDPGSQPGPAGEPPGAHPAAGGGTGADQQARVPADLADRVHMSLLAGLLSHIGMKDAVAPARSGAGARTGRRGPAEFTGARGARFAVSPGSALAKKPPPWVVAAELVETSRLWARTAARIEPEWAERLAPHLVRYSYSEPHWHGRRGETVASEKVTLYGLPVVAARQVSYGRIDPAAAREAFISHALVEGDWQTHHWFFHHNRKLLAEATDLERRARRRGLVADDEALFRFYDQRIPAHVTSARHFDTWWKQARAADPGLLTLSPGDLTGPDAGAVSPADYPGTWGGLGLSYEFAPGDPGDGVSVDVPLATLNQVRAEEFGWQVPGLRAELVTALLRTLPKHLRTAFVPAPDTARAVLTRLGQPRGDLLDALASELRRLTGVSVPRDAWDTSRLPPHLRMTFRVVGEGRVLAAGKDLAALREQVAPDLAAELSAAGRGITRSGLRTWDIGALPREFSDGRVRAYPALADTGDAVDVTLFDTPARAAASMRAGTRRLLLLAVPSGARQAAGRLPVTAKLALSRHPYPGAAALLEDCAACAADQVIADAGGPAWDAPGFGRLVEAARSALPAITATVVDDVARVLGEAHEVQVGIDRATSPVLAPAVRDIRAQFAGLIHPGFVSAAGARRLPDLARYLRAITVRLAKAPEAPGRDAERMATVHRVSAAYEQAVQDLAATGGGDAGQVRWLIEELRVSLFAQAIGTPVRVSERRILAALDRLPAG